MRPENLALSAKKLRLVTCETARVLQDRKAEFPEHRTPNGRRYGGDPRSSPGYDVHKVQRPDARSYVASPTTPSLIRRAGIVSCPPTSGCAPSSQSHWWATGSAGCCRLLCRAGSGSVTYAGPAGSGGPTSRGVGGALRARNGDHDNATVRVWRGGTERRHGSGAAA